MGQRDAASETSSDSVDGERAPSFVERQFWPLLVGVILLSATVGVGVVYLQYGQVDQTLQSVPYTDRVARTIPYIGSPADSLAESSKEPREYGSFTRMQGLVVNPAGSAGNRYLAVSLAFESKSRSVEEEIQRKKVVVRDAVLSLLSEQTVDELADPSQRDELKSMLREETNGILRSGTVDRLYFTEFVLQ
jgi:flagellar FliL protein